jgi:hypothetical protein
MLLVGRGPPAPFCPPYAGLGTVAPCNTKLKISVVVFCLTRIQNFNFCNNENLLIEPIFLAVVKVQKWKKRICVFLAWFDFWDFYSHNQLIS